MRYYKLSGFGGAMLFVTIAIILSADFSVASHLPAKSGGRHRFSEDPGYHRQQIRLYVKDLKDRMARSQSSLSNMTVSEWKVHYVDPVQQAIKYIGQSLIKLELLDAAASIEPLGAENSFPLINHELYGVKHYFRSVMQSISHKPPIIDSTVLDAKQLIEKAGPELSRQINLRLKELSETAEQLLVRADDIGQGLVMTDDSSWSASLTSLKKVHDIRKQADTILDAVSNTIYDAYETHGWQDHSSEFNSHSEYFAKIAYALAQIELSLASPDIFHGLIINDDLDVASVFPTTSLYQLNDYMADYASENTATLDWEELWDAIHRLPGSIRHLFASGIMPELSQFHEYFGGKALRFHADRLERIGDSIEQLAELHQLGTIERSKTVINAEEKFEMANEAMKQLTTATGNRKKILKEMERISNDPIRKDIAKRYALFLIAALSAGENYSVVIQPSNSESDIRDDISANRLEWTLNVFYDVDPDNTDLRGSFYIETEDKNVKSVRFRHEEWLDDRFVQIDQSNSTEFSGMLSALRNVATISDENADILNGVITHLESL